MNLSTKLDPLVMESAVLGGAILGCGGGGKLEDGLLLGELAMAQAGAHLVEPGTLSTPTQLAIVGLVHNLGTDTRQTSPRQAHHAVDLLQSELDMPITGLINAGAGAVDSILGWELSGYLTAPLLDMGLPGTYHPFPLPNLLLFLAKTAASETFTITLAGHFDQARGSCQHLWRGRPAQLLKKLGELPTSQVESFVFATSLLSSPSTIAHSRASTINHILQIGQTIISTNDDGGEATVAAVRDLLSLKFSTFATVTQISWQGHGQDAYGLIELRDIANRQLALTYSQRYLELWENGKLIAAFPDLIITLGILGTPLTGEEVFIGQDIYLIVATSSG